MFGKEFGSPISYMSAFVFGGFVQAFGLSGYYKKYVDIFIRPAYNIFVEDILLEGNGSIVKYADNVYLRAITSLIPSNIRWFARGISSGLYYKYTSSGTNDTLGYWLNDLLNGD